MPRLAELADAGVHGSIASTDPPEPVPAWAAFATGRDPGRTGIVGERRRDWQRTRQGRRAPYAEGVQASSQDLQASTLWSRAAKAGHRVALAGVPLTYPVEPIDGQVVAGPPAPPDRFATHPSGLADELSGELGHDGVGTVPADADRASALAEAREAMDRRFDVAEHLAEDDWELFVAVVPELRRALQAAWADDEDRAAVHRQADERLADLVDALPDETAILVVSAAGTQTSQGAVRLNLWLRREGYLALAEDPEPGTGFDPELVDWANTTAWATGGAAGRIHLNVEGREPAGTVDPLNYEAVRDEIADELARIETSERTLAAQALKPREVHEGACVDEGPDLLCYVEGLAVACEAELGHGDLVREPVAGVDEAAPTREGALVLRDPEARYTGSVDELAMVDGAPTVWDLLGVGVPEDVDGRVLKPDGSLKQA